MSDLRTIMRVADEVAAPDLWSEIKARAAVPAQAPPRRLAPKLVAVTAALAAIATAVVTLIPRPPSAQAIVREAIEDFESVPPFRVTIVGPSAPGLVGPTGSVATLELSYRDANAWRLELIDVPPPSPGESIGSFNLWDGESLFTYEAASNTYSVTSNISREFSPLGFLSWQRRGGIAFWQERCGRKDAKVLDDEKVAGRVARHVRCGEVDLWIDGDTGLMMKIRSNQQPSDMPEPFPGPLGLMPGTSVEITSVEYHPAFTGGLFRFTAPVGAKQAAPLEEENEEALSSVLRRGSVAPSWRRPLLGGGSLGTKDVRGKPTAIYFWATWCTVCVGDRLDVLQDSFRTYADRMNVVSVAVNDERSALNETMDSGEFGFPVVVDEGESLGVVAELFGLTSVPSLILLDAEGRVAAVITNRGISAQELEGYLSAFAEGRALPSPAER